MSYVEQQNNNLIQIHGGKELTGSIMVQGSKNASLPLLAASVLIAGQSRFINYPCITDLFYMEKLLRSVGCVITEKTEYVGGVETPCLQVQARDVYDGRLPGEYVEKMRSSIILLGPLLARRGEAHLRLPGGCSIGKRPVDYHIAVMRALGAEVTVTETDIHASCTRLQGARIHLPMASVGATENAVLAAVLAQGETVIENAAKEPEIMILCDFLKQAGADISLQYIDNILIITIEGVETLHEVSYVIPADRIVAGTYLFGCVAAGGDILLQGVEASHMEETIRVACRMGAQCQQIQQNGRNGLAVQMRQRPAAIPYLETAVYPGFPTDMQSAFMVAATLSDGKTRLCERIFENRYQIVEELRRMGAKITLVHTNTGICADIEGVDWLQGCNTLAHELRGGASLVIAGIAAQGITTVGNTYFIDRGYENIGRDLNRLGAMIGVTTGCREE